MSEFRSLVYMSLLDKIKGGSSSDESAKKDNSKKIAELQKKYDALLAESYKLSTSNRTASDAKRYDAELVWKEIEKLKS